MSFIRYCLVSLFVLFASSCSKPRGDYEIYLGTISGPETELVEIAKEVAKNKYNLHIKIVEFEDYNLPNVALVDGSIDANMFQHEPYLNLAMHYKGFDLAIVGKTFVYPMGIYSKKYNSIDSLPHNATIAIPIDPSNGARALRLLANANLIEIPNVDDMHLRPTNIVKNPKNLHIVELDAAQLPRVLTDVDAAIINTNFAIPAGLIPAKHAIFLEDKQSPYANIVVVRKKDKDHPKFTLLMEALHSDEVATKARELFRDQAIQAW
ncbi:MAG TPA: MetQ/NlpA family ABC transporter substrate-binding protein [Gammaproteobacteria bacterium]|nr:MetQ/NlpA family ABC transporter substrate-binding protein [Gammaproteobacteria bacterium]